MRIELLSTADRSLCLQKVPYETALAELRTTYGENNASDAFEGTEASTQSAAFSGESVDVALHTSRSSDDCSTRIIYKARRVKDASEL